MNDARIEIREASADDVADIQQCADAAYSKYTDRMDRRPGPMDADFANQVAKGHVHVALYEQQFSGYVVFYVENDHVHLENVAVLPDRSGKGIGKRLIDCAEQFAKQKGLKTIELYTNEAMAENLAMYPRLGYQEIGRKIQAGFNRVYFRKPV